MGELKRATNVRRRKRLFDARTGSPRLAKQAGHENELPKTRCALWARRSNGLTKLGSRRRGDLDDDRCAETEEVVFSNANVPELHGRIVTRGSRRVAWPKKPVDSSRGSGVI